MADIHNPNIPQLANQISADIVDIKENLEFHKDVFENFMNEWSNADATDQYPAYWERTTVNNAASPYTMLAADIIMEVDTSGGAVEIDLLDATVNTKRYFIIKLVDATNALTLDPNGAQTVDGESSLLLSTVDQCVMFYSDGSNWQRIFNNVLKNDEYLKSSNAAGDGKVDLVKATPADQIQFGEQSSTILAEQISTVVGDTHTNTTIDSIPDTSKINVGMTITGSGIPASTTVTVIVDGTTITISQAATGTTADVIFTLKTATDANQVALYSRETHHDGAQSELFFREESSGDEVLMTSKGVPWMPPGIILPYAASTPPATWLECNAADTSMTTHENLYDIIGNTYGLNTGETVTFTNATNTANDSAHGLSENDVIEFTNSGGALPTGLSADTKYYMIEVAANTFKMSTTYGGSEVAISDDGSGTNTYHNEMKVPDLRGQFIRGWDHGAGTDPQAAGRTDRGDGVTGDYVGTLQTNDIEHHAHDGTTDSDGAHVHEAEMGNTTGAGTDPAEAPNATGGTMEVNSSGAHTHAFTSDTDGGVDGDETRPLNINMMYIIKT